MQPKPANGAAVSQSLEHAERIGKKILISGGGRCNFTNLHCRPEHFISANPHFAKSALARYTPQQFISLVEKHGIEYHEKTLGQLFCNRSATGIVNMLEHECRAANVGIFVNTRIQSITRNSGYEIRTDGIEFRAAGDRDCYGRPLHTQNGRDRVRI